MGRREGLAMACRAEKGRARLSVRTAGLHRPLLGMLHILPFLLQVFRAYAHAGQLAERLPICACSPRDEPTPAPWTCWPSCVVRQLRPLCWRPYALCSSRRSATLASLRVCCACLRSAPVWWRTAPRRWWSCSARKTFWRSPSPEPYTLNPKPKPKPLNCRFLLAALF